MLLLFLCPRKFHVREYDTKKAKVANVQETLFFSHFSGKKGNGI